MDFLICMNNFPWNRFATAYENNSKQLKDCFIKMYEGKADEQDYQYAIDRLEHQATLYRVSPWGLKFYFYLLSTNKANNSNILQHINVIVEAAMFHKQEDSKPSKKDLEKYEKLKSILLDSDFDGNLDNETLKTLKTIDCQFIYLSIMDLIGQNIQLLESFIQNKDVSVAERALKLLEHIRNPKLCCVREEETLNVQSKVLVVNEMSFTPLNNNGISMLYCITDEGYYKITKGEMDEKVYMELNDPSNGEYFDTDFFEYNISNGSLSIYVNENRPWNAGIYQHIKLLFSPLEQNDFNELKLTIENLLLDITVRKLLLDI